MLIFERECANRQYKIDVMWQKSNLLVPMVFNKEGILFHSNQNMPGDGENFAQFAILT